MVADVESAVRGPEAFALARKAIDAMEHNQVWPTALNYELWLHVVGDPDGPIAREIERHITQGEVFTETFAEELAATYLPKARLNEQIRNAGDQLSRELATVAKAIEQAQKTNEQYGATLAGASRELAVYSDPSEIKRLVDTLASATRRVQRENKSLEKRLSDSTAEVNRLKDHLEQVRRDAATDSLTNLANRKAFDDEFSRACEDADASGEPLTLALIDIDHFKSFNDTWGHQTGDQVIRYVASVMGRMAPPPRFAARYGGEEFAMIFPGETAPMVEQVLEEIREEVSSRMLKRRSTNEDLGTITVSAGIAQRANQEAAHMLLERADAALYASKRSGRNRVTNAEAVDAAA